MKLMVELDTANARETFLLAEFLTKVSLIERGADAERETVTTGAPPVDLAKIPSAGLPQEFIDRVTETTAPPGPDVVGRPSNVVPLKPEIPPPPPPPGAIPVAPEYDSNGMPWDARIHASTKAKTIAGAWKNRRGVVEADRLAIEATLVRQAPDPARIPPPPPTSATPPPPTPEQMGVTRVNGVVVPPGASIADAVAVMKSGTPPVPGAMPAATMDDEADLEPDVPTGETKTAAPAIPPGPTEPPVIDFPTLMIKVSEAMAAGSMTLDSVKAKIKPLGAESLFELSGKPDLVVPCAEALGFA